MAFLTWTKTGIYVQGVQEKNIRYNKYFRLRFELVNTINHYLRLEICVMWLGKF